MLIFSISSFFTEVLKYIKNYWFLFSIFVILMIALVSLIFFYKGLFSSFKAFIASDEERIHLYTENVLKQHEDDFLENEDIKNIEDIIKVQDPVEATGLENKKDLLLEQKQKNKYLE